MKPTTRTRRQFIATTSAAEASRTTLDVGLPAVNAFLMVQERRRTEALVSEQLSFARDVVSAANAR